MESPTSVNLTQQTLYTQTLGQLDLQQRLTSGSHGVLYLGQGMDQLYAVKHVQNAHLEPAARLRQHLEAEIHHSASSIRHVHPVHEACIAEGEGNGWFLITDYMPEGDLYTWLLRHGIINPTTAKKLLLQMAEAVAELHQRGIYHRDIKPENILVSVSNSEVDLKLTDFGMATRQRWTRACGYGSLVYMPPESIPYQNDSGIETDPLKMDAALHDVWSLGQLALNLFLAVSAWHHPTRTDSCFAFYAQDPKVNLLRYLRITEEFNAILIRAFALDPMQRCTAKEFIELVRECEDFVVSQEELDWRRQQWHERPVRSRISKGSRVSRESKRSTESEITDDSAIDMDKKPSVWGKVKRTLLRRR